MSFRKSTEKTSHPAKQQIESRPPGNEGNDIDAVVEQIPFQSICTILCSGCPISRGLANTKGLAASNKGKTAAYKRSNN